MFKQIIKTIHTLRVLLFAVILFSFLIYVGISPMDVGRFIGAKFSSAMGVNSYAQIQPNPFNTLALQLKEKETRIITKEKAVDQREYDLIRAASLQNKIIIFLTIGIIVLFVLIVINYYMDYKRRRSERNKTI